jgi:hypothetical protein
MKVFHVCEVCEPIHVDDCRSCLGWGFKVGTKTPICSDNLTILKVCETCPECGGNLENKQLYELKKKMYEPIKIKTESAYGTQVASNLWR